MYEMSNEFSKNLTYKILMNGLESVIEFQDFMEIWFDQVNRKFWGWGLNPRPHHMQAIKTINNKNEVRGFEMG